MKKLSDVFEWKWTDDRSTFICCLLERADERKKLDYWKILVVDSTIPAFCPGTFHLFSMSSSSWEKIA